MICTEFRIIGKQSLTAVKIAIHDYMQHKLIWCHWKNHIEMCLHLL